MSEEKEQANLWEKVGNKCLEHALELLDAGTILDDDKTRAVGKLVEIAISIDMLNLHWEEHKQKSRAAGLLDRQNRKINLDGNSGSAAINADEVIHTINHQVEESMKKPVI